MGLLKKFFSKQNNQEQESMQEQIVKRLKANTLKPIVRFTLEKEKPDIFDSKIGGSFYVPEDMEVPVHQDTNEPLYLLAQLNFSQIEHIDDFPEKGLLQIFIGQDDLYGCDFDDPLVQKGFCIRYFENIPDKVSSECIFQSAWRDECYSPLENDSEYKLIGHVDTQIITMSDYRFDQALKQYCQDSTPDGCESVYDLDNEAIDALYDLLPTYACQIGGYPCFTQTDPREYDYNDYDVLLFQLDTIEDIMWGDSGVGNFFIKKEDLKNKDFSHVLYNWDCC